MKTARLPDPATLLSTHEAAKLLSVSVRTVQLWVENGVLHAWKTAGGHRRIARTSVESILAQQQAVIETVSGLKPLKVVLIDDNPAQLKLYKLKIDSLNLPVVLTIASNGFEGMVTVGRADPDAIVVSLDIEGIDVFEMVRSIINSSPRSRIIALTAKRDSEKVSALRRLSPKGTILEPIDELDSIGPLLRSQLEARGR